MRLTINEIQDLEVKKAFKQIENEFNSEPIVKGKFKFFEITVPSAVTSEKYKHNLGFIPRDVITMCVTNNSGVTWNYDYFDKTYLVFSTTASCTIRCFAGRYEEGL